MRGLKLPEQLEQLANKTVEELLNRFPETAEVFYQYGMACVGCAVAPFYTVADAIEIYKLSQMEFLSQLAQAINNQP